jgi:hypothetical protein
MTHPITIRINSAFGPPALRWVAVARRALRSKRQTDLTNVTVDLPTTACWRTLTYLPAPGRAARYASVGHDRNGVMSRHRRKSQKVGEGTPRVGPPVGRFGPFVCLQLSRWGQSLSGPRGPSTSGPFAGPAFPTNSTARRVKILQPCSPSCAAPRQRSTLGQCSRVA